MATLKVKNSLGEWENVANAGDISFVGDLKVVNIARATETTYDLSSYVTPGQNFILAFTAKAHVTDTYSPVYVWIGSEGRLRGEHTGKPYSNSDMDYRYLFGNSISTDDDEITASYDNETRIFTIAGVGSYKPALSTGTALLFYAG